MNNIIKKVLTKIEESGFEAYIIGGYVRDFILGKKTTDVDICTNALPKDIIDIFPNANTENYGSVAFKIGKYNFDITTYREDENYEKRKPLKIKYVDNLLTDIKRRDFTINALCMNSSGNIIDLIDGQIDCQNRQIKVIGDINQKLTEDPLRILRAIRFSITLDFEMDARIIEFINKNQELIKSLSYFRKQEELNKIFSSKNALKGLKLLKELNLLEALEIQYSDNIKAVNDLLGIWAQIDYSKEYPFNKNSQETIKKIREIVAHANIDNIILFKYNLYLSTVAAEILDIDRNLIASKYAALPIKNNQEIKVQSKDIIDILNLTPGSTIKTIKEDVLNQILNGNLKNDYDIIKKYLLDNWK